MGAEPHFALVQRKVGNAAAQFEEPFPRIAVRLVLPHRIVHSLLSEVVLQLEGENRQAVDEERDVQRPLGLVAAIAKLPRHGEAVLLKALTSGLVAFRGAGVEQLQVMRAVPDSVTKDMDRPALADLALKPRKKPTPGGAVFRKPESRRCFRVGVVKEGSKLG